MKKGFWSVVKDIIKKSDIVILVLDARFPELTRVKKMESYAASCHKPLLLILNKIDILSDLSIKNLKSQYNPSNSTLLSAKLSKGIDDLIKKIKTLTKKEQPKVAIIGYPNTGKSTLINQLSKGGKAKTSSESGYTKGIQLITGKQGLQLFDSPGIVPYADRSELRLGLMSSISPSKLKDPDLVAFELIKMFKKNNPEELEKVYRIDINQNSQDILLELGKNKKMLLKKGEVDEHRAAVQFLYDWHKGKIKL